MKVKQEKYRKWNGRKLTNNEVIEIANNVGEVVYTIRGPGKKLVNEMEVTIDDINGETKRGVFVRVIDHGIDKFIIKRNDEIFEIKRGNKKITLRITPFWHRYWSDKKNGRRTRKETRR